MKNAAQRLLNMECPKGPVDLVIDSDTYNEIDDQFAISYALHAPEKIRVKALYAAPFTNERSTGPADGMEKSYQEMLKLLSLSGKTGCCPVFRGSDRYLPDEHMPVPSEAASDLIHRAGCYTPENPLYVVSIGAITNIASALLMNPDIADRIVVVWLGGNALHWPDNMEFNCKQDVAAARIVLGSGAPLVLLPCMGVVSAFTTTGPELEHWLRGKNALCDYLVDHTIEAAEEYAKGKIWSRVIWDVTAVGWLLNDDSRLMLDRLVPAPIPGYDHHYSQDESGPVCRMVYHIHRDALFSDLIRHIAVPAGT
jgi:inosine-uridine nucleoside N-ribohydrolase